MPKGTTEWLGGWVCYASREAKGKPNCLTLPKRRSGKLELYYSQRFIVEDGRNMTQIAQIVAKKIQGGDQENIFCLESR